MSDTTSTPPAHTDARWLNEEEREAWLFISSMMFNLPGQLENQLNKDSGLSFVEYMVLAMLSESPEHMLTMTELARQTNTLLPRLSRVVTRLEKNSYVERTIWAKDRRVSICHLLPEGLAKVQSAAPGHVEAVRQIIFDKLNTRQVRSLAKIGESVLGDKPSAVINVSNVASLK
ncbi:MULTISPECIES: MarR family winged helix-turn-helix transcriptional regulator [Rothia]|uniref:MarR family transcriptional regulator n=1 Tax=Rothia nasimurium TaxID=85336 RepID=A0A1Y1RMX5_9MICC|nr:MULTISPECIES: MarR family transcriptional regulator [Rothia]ORC15950.1 MarR family transcriptional regulator [Rothia nasimurium]